MWSQSQNGVDLEYFRAVGAHDGRRSLIFVGSLNWYPNVSAVEFLLKEIWPPLRQAIPDLTLEIVGSAPPRSLVELAAALPGVTVHGFVDDVRPLMDAATLYVCPIRDGGGTESTAGRLRHGKVRHCSPGSVRGDRGTRARTSSWRNRAVICRGDPAPSRATRARRQVGSAAGRWSSNAMGSRESASDCATLSKAWLPQRGPGHHPLPLEITERGDQRRNVGQQQVIRAAEDSECGAPRLQSKADYPGNDDQELADEQQQVAELRCQLNIANEGGEPQQGRCVAQPLCDQSCQANRP